MKYLHSFSPLAVLAVLMSLIALAGAGASFVFARSSVSDATTAKAAAITPSIPAAPITALSPVGKWSLTVTFIQGSRAKQTEASVMIFQLGGIAKATFPGSTQIPATGVWSMVVHDAFQYSFDETLIVNGQTIGYVSVHITAFLTQPNTYVAGGIGIAYATQTHQPLGGAYNVTLTNATRIS